MAEDSDIVKSVLKDGNEDSDIYCLRLGEVTAEEASEIA